MRVGGDDAAAAEEPDGDPAARADVGGRGAAGPAHEGLKEALGLHLHHAQQVQRVTVRGGWVATWVGLTEMWVVLPYCLGNRLLQQWPTSQGNISQINPNPDV